ncbi:hypothetical protein FPZ12_013790 [Amycolatopsis acidicola]|uniref:REase associating with pPIWI RE domain-containing protein n=1 Tax=Amycolatopsis acidicola TaxID=2596893 RepID=A0A5N0V593_9PSEU|nr:hypothetical protein [Amycolatopsis acidicola]KAA9161579.1 hypothetical protein FPZ12_013790 [Amycolatopsis acidicola]
MTDPREAQAFQPIPQWRRVVAAALRAAYAWSERRTQPTAMREVSRMTGVVMAAHGPGVGPVTPREFATALHRPLGELRALADCPETEAAAVVLLEAGQLTAEAFDLASEYAAPLGTAIDRATWMPTWTRMHAEQIRHETYAAMVASGRQDDYVRSRRFLIEHPAGSSAELADQRSKAGVQLPPNGYGPIPAGQLYHSRSGSAWWFPCPSCRWPMAVTGELTRCRYRPHSASYRIRPGATPERRPVLERADPGPSARAPKAKAAAGAVCVDTGVWRFVVVPGVSELRLFHALDKPGVDVELWPDFDRYDLRVEIGSTVHQADLKEYQSVGRLIADLTAQRPAADIVLPATHEHQLEVLRQALPATVHITTEKRFRDRILRQLRRNT